MLQFDDYFVTLLSDLGFHGNISFIWWFSNVDNDDDDEYNLGKQRCDY